MPPKLEEIGETVGVEIAGALPMDWRHRLVAINSGKPIAEQSPRCPYNQALEGLLDHLDNQGGRRTRRGLFAQLLGR